jgi:predicted RNase H-like nuclease (RuvC/YqgF family)
MHSAYKKISCLCGLALCVSATAYGQALGDVARQQRQKQQAKKSQAAPKVVTNEDIPEHPQDPSDQAAPDAPPAHAPGSKSAERWKAEIQAQKQTVATLQGQIDKLNSSVHFVEANRYWNGAQYNQRQEQKQEQVERMKAQLAEQQKRLDEMQEGARKDGYGNAVYEP